MISFSSKVVTAHTAIVISFSSRVLKGHGAIGDNKQAAQLQSTARQCIWQSAALAMTHRHIASQLQTWLENEQQSTMERGAKCGYVWRLACHSWSSSGVRAMYLLMTAASRWPQCSGDSHCVKAVLASSRGLLSSLALSAQHRRAVVQALWRSCIQRGRCKWRLRMTATWRPSR